MHQIFVRTETILLERVFEPRPVQPELPEQITKPETKSETKKTDWSA
jgi:hypothetical protein